MAPSFDEFLGEGFEPSPEQASEPPETLRSAQEGGDGTAPPETGAPERTPAAGSAGVAQTAGANAPSGSTPAHAQESSQEPLTATAEAPTSPQEPFGVSQATTPSGIEIYYQAGPKRLYRLRAAALRPEEEGGYPTDWREVPSVSTVLDILHKPALTWWGMKMGVEGVAALVSLAESADDHQALFHALDSKDVDWVVDQLTANKLTVNHKRDRAADRGTGVHDVFETWAKTGLMPQPDVFPDDERGYVEGLVRFITETNITPVATEVMVGSVEHGYAGRFDLEAEIGECEVVTKTYPKKADKRETLRPGPYTLDLKTSKGVYESHFLQLEAYEKARVECGYAPTLHRAVIHVTADGRYELVVSKARFDEFLAVRRCYEALQTLKRRK